MTSLSAFNCGVDLSNNFVALNYTLKIYFLGTGTFDVVVVNLYPFYDKVTSGTISFDEGIENIDIGGPTMIRAAAKVTSYCLFLPLFTEQLLP